MDFIFASAEAAFNSFILASSIGLISALVIILLAILSVEVSFKQGVYSAAFLLVLFSGLGLTSFFEFHEITASEEQLTLSYSHLRNKTIQPQDITDVRFKTYVRGHSCSLVVYTKNKKYHSINTKDIQGCKTYARTLKNTYLSEH